jgi:hypothetical protein
VGERRLLEGAEHEPPGAQRTSEGVAGAAGDQLGGACDDAGLRPAEQLVAGEGDEVGAGAEGLAGRRLTAQPRRRPVPEPRAGGVEEPGADVDDQGHPEPGEVGHRDVLGEAGDPVVRGVHLEDGGGPGRVGPAAPLDRPAVVVEAGAVRRADLHQGRPRLLEDVGDAEPTADLDQLTPADRDPPPRGEGAEHQDDRPPRSC